VYMDGVRPSTIPFGDFVAGNVIPLRSDLGRCAHAGFNPSSSASIRSALPRDPDQGWREPPRTSLREYNYCSIARRPSSSSTAEAMPPALVLVRSRAISSGNGADGRDDFTSAVGHSSPMLAGAALGPALGTRGPSTRHGPGRQSDCRKAPPGSDHSSVYTKPEHDGDQSLFPLMPSRRARNVRRSPVLSGGAYSLPHQDI